LLIAGSTRIRASRSIIVAAVLWAVG